MNRRNIIFTLLSFFCGNFFSQADKTIDSLKLALKNAKHDTIRCNILLRLATLADENEWPQFNEELRNLSESKLKPLTAANPLARIYKKYLASALSNKGIIARRQGDIKSAMDFFNKTLQLCGEINYIEGTSSALNDLGQLYNKQGEIKKAIEYLNRGLEIKVKLKDNIGMADIMNNLGGIYADQGDIPKALEFNHKSLKIQEEIKDSIGIRRSLNDLGNLYNHQNDPGSALNYYSKALKLSEQQRDRNGIALMLVNIAAIYSKHGDLLCHPARDSVCLRAGQNKALEYYFRSLKISEGQDNKRAIANCCNNIGTLYFRNGDPACTSNAVTCRKEGRRKGMEYYGRALKIMEEINDKKGVSTSLFLTATAFFELEQTQEAEANAKKSFRIASELGFPASIRNASELLFKIYKKKNTPKPALEMYELFILMRDSINNEQTKKATIKSQLKYEYEKKSAADSVKNAEQQKVKNAQLSAQNATLKQEKFQRYSLVVGLLIVLGGLGFVINRFRVTSKQKKVIEEQKIVVDEAFEK
ncbi:MAG: tetratricopeptide repeat protein, partial [Bacteroidia bacterium]|nr:tetratricopeptide repeat protein [Bacteroidia bacterium]